jgi:hypothetical protein
MSEQINAPVVNKRAGLNAALAQIKKEISPVTKDGKNPHFKSTFATLNAHIQAVEPILEKYGCVLTQPTVFDPRTGRNVQITKITHTASGESDEASLDLGDHKDPQKLGSAITYFRRYTLAALLGMQAEDDDANYASAAVNSKSNVAPKVVAKKGDF